MKTNLSRNHWGWYSKPSLITCRGDVAKKWFVQFYFHETDESGQILSKKQLQFKGGINYYHKKSERLAEGNAFRSVIQDKLADDWHPVTDAYPQRELSAYQQWQEKPITVALTEIQKEMKVSAETARAYRLAVNYFNACAVKVNLHDTKIKAVKRSTIIQIWNAYKKSDHAWNKNLGYIAALFSRITQLADLVVNPCFGIKKRSLQETAGYIPPTDAEQVEIKRKLITDHYLFYRYISVIYDAGMRPNEILALRISDINIDNRMIKIIPDSCRDNSKTKSIRFVPITDDLLRFFEQMKLEEFPKHYYVFGSPAKPGRGWTGVKSKKDYFLPAPVRIKRDTVTRLWKEIVKDGLGYSCDLYGLKHKGTDDKLLAGIDIDSLKTMYGHSSKRMTEKYASVLFRIHSKDIVSKSPSF